jgi:hypothetical protein
VRNELSRHETERLAGRAAYGTLQFAQIDDILEEGLHEYLTSFLARSTNWATASAATSCCRWRLHVRTMTMQLTIATKRRYRYTAPLSYTIQQLHLTPRVEPQQHVLHWQHRARRQLPSPIPTPTATCRTC